MPDESEPPVRGVDSGPGDEPDHPENTHTDDSDTEDRDTEDSVGTVIAFPLRSGVTGRPSDSVARETPHSGYEVDNEPVIADGSFTGGTAFAGGTDPAGSTGLPGGAVLVASADPDEGGDETRPVDWAWVEEWRAGHEPVPWASGLGLAGFSALIVGVAVWVLSAGLANTPVLAIAVNLLVAAGLAPAMWLSRGLPVLRWIALGSAIGVLVGWVCAVTMLPVPTP